MIVISVVTLLAVVWEVLEFFRDAYLLDVVLLPLADFRLRLNVMSQPSNFDTMGDLMLGLLGSLLALPLRRRELRTPPMP